MSNLVPCKKCKTNVAKRDKTCPQCGVANPGLTAIDNAKGCLAMLILLPIIFFGFKSCFTDNRTPEEKLVEEKARLEERCSNHVSALAMSERFVKKQLKSPSTAEFPNLYTDGVTVAYIGDCTHIVSSYVDSQNGFGAVTRSTYSAELKSDPKTGEYTLLGIDIN
mgnify:CR=1 FL=1